jgi:hypothetical protein
MARLLKPEIMLSVVLPCVQVLAFIFGLVYWQQKLDQLGLANINGALFLMQTQMTFGFIFNVVMVMRFLLNAA